MNAVQLNYYPNKYHITPLTFYQDVIADSVALPFYPHSRVKIFLPHSFEDRADPFAFKSTGISPPSLFLLFFGQLSSSSLSILREFLRVFLVSVIFLFLFVRLLLDRDFVFGISGIPLGISEHAVGGEYRLEDVVHERRGGGFGGGSVVVESLLGFWWALTNLPFHFYLLLYGGLRFRFLRGEKGEISKSEWKIRY